MKKIILVLLLLYGVFFAACAIGEYKDLHSIDLSAAEEVTAEIDLIGLPDGTPIVSFYDSAGVLHEDVPIHNVTIRKLFDREYSEGKSVKLKYDAGSGIAVSVPYFMKWFLIYLSLAVINAALSVLIVRKMMQKKKPTCFQ